MPQEELGLDIQIYEHIDIYEYNIQTETLWGDCNKLYSQFKLGL